VKFGPAVFEMGTRADHRQMDVCRHDHSNTSTILFTILQTGGAKNTGRKIQDTKCKVYLISILSRYFKIISCIKFNKILTALGSYKFY